MIQIIESCFVQINREIQTSSLQTSPLNISLQLFDIYIDNVVSSSIKFIHSGEYVNFLKNGNIEDIISKLTAEIEGTNNTLSLIGNAAIQNRLTEAFNISKDLLEEIFKNCIVFFLNNVSELSKFQYTIIHRNFTFLTTKNPKLYELFEYSNIFLLEYLLEESIEYYEHLGILEKRIENYHQKRPFTKRNILRCKLVFLKYKWKKRQKYNRIFIKENIDANFSKKYVFANEEIDLSKKIKVGDEFYQFVEDWVKKIEIHYFEGSNDIDEIYSSSMLVTANEELRNNFKLFFTIKFYKDLEEDFPQLENLKTHIKTSKLDKKNKLYYFNNLFSLLVKHGEKDEDAINKYFKEIKSYSDSSQSNNYFIYYKFLDYKLKLVNDKVKQNKISPKELEAYIKECEILNNDCNKKFEWTYRSFNILYQFDKEDCLIDYNGEEIYFPTAFLLPISVTENKFLIANKLEKINDLKYKLIELKSNKYNETIKEQIKENEKKSIEMISLFTAVISFIMGSISGFKFIDNIYNAISFIIIFGLCLSIFLILILKLIRKDGTYSVLDFLPVFLVLLILVFVCLDLSSKNVVSKENLHDELIKLKVLPNDSKSDKAD